MRKGTKFSEAQMAAIVEALRGERPMPAIAREFGISRAWLGVVNRKFRIRPSRVSTYRPEGQR